MVPKEIIGSAAGHIASLSKKACGSVKEYVPAARKKLWQGFYRFTRLTAYGVGIYLKKRAARSAAQFSFFILMTIFPLIICLHWILGMLNESSSRLIGMISEVFPATLTSMFSEYLNYVSSNNSSTILVAGLIMLVTPSAAAFRALRGILCDIRERREPNDLLLFVLSFFISVVMLLILYLSMFLLFTGSRLLRFLVDSLHVSSRILGWNWIRFLLLFTMILMMLYIMYRFAHINITDPREVLKGKALPGAVAASILIVGVSIVYSWFISISTRYSLVYGSLTSVIILMLWLYTCSNIIIAGGILNRVLDQRARLVRNLRIPESMHAAASSAHQSLRAAIESGKKQDIESKARNGVKTDFFGLSEESMRIYKSRMSQSRGKAAGPKAMDHHRKKHGRR